MRVLLLLELILCALCISFSVCAMEKQRSEDQDSLIRCHKNQQILINKDLFPLIPGMKDVKKVDYEAHIVNYVVACASRVQKKLKTRNEMLQECQKQPLPKADGNQYILHQVNDLVKKKLSIISVNDIADTIHAAYDLRALLIVNACTKLWLDKLPWPSSFETVYGYAKRQYSYTDIINNYLKKQYDIKSRLAPDELKITDLMALDKIPIHNNCAYLADKQLTSLKGTDHLVNSTNITGLLLANNKLAYIRWLPKLGTLTFLSASHNQIIKIAAQEFGDNIKTLYLNFNQITSIDEDAFKNLQLLEELWLDNNKLTYINPLVFSGLANLKLLVLSNNQLLKKNITEIEKILPNTTITNEKK